MRATRPPPSLWPRLFDSTSPRLPNRGTSSEGPSLAHDVPYRPPQGSPRPRTLSTADVGSHLPSYLRPYINASSLPSSAREPSRNADTPDVSSTSVNFAQLESWLHADADLASPDRRSAADPLRICELGQPAFRPMDAALPSRVAAAPPRVNLLLERIRAGFSGNYQGDISVDRNRSADIPIAESCSLFVTGLPPDVTTQELLAPIRKMGRIYATHINRPQPERGHFSSAAKIVFFEKEAAAKFFTWSNINGFIVNGHRARVVYNRIRTAEDKRLASRVVCIAGPPLLVNESVLQRYFATKFAFQVDEVLDHGIDENDNALVEFRFGSFRCQAQAAVLTLNCECPEYITAFYGLDPCQ